MQQQLKIVEMQIMIKSIIGIAILLGTTLVNAQSLNKAESLNGQQQSLVRIAALTANGDLKNLSKFLNEGLDAGLTVNEIKEALVHSYAYCGFPRSIRGLQTFMEVLDARKKKGITDREGRSSSPINSDGSKYELGKKILAELTKAPQDGPLKGYSEFAPSIDIFLKEHLFADIFERDVLTYAQRELVTISVLSSLGGVEPMLRGHFSISLNVGITPNQLANFIGVIESAVGKEKADAAKAVLVEVIKSR